MKNVLILIVGMMSFQINAQDLSLFSPLMDKVWYAEGIWGDGSSFKQEIEFNYALEGSIVVAKSKGFIDQSQTQYGNRNHGIRKVNPESGKIEFWEFDVFGGVTQGEVTSSGRDIIYTYKYGSSIVTDYWKYVDDDTYQYTVGSYSDGKWNQKYLETRFETKLTLEKTLTVLSEMLIGSWESDAWGGTLSETWTSENNVLTQDQKLIQDGAVTYRATTYIERKGEALILTSIINNGNAKIYKAESWGHTSITFTNKDYANPDTLIYTWNPQGYERVISGIEDEKKSTTTFSFRPTSN